MKHVTQANLCGCMPAAFAMVTGDHYYGSCSFFKPRDFDKAGASGMEAMEILEKLGYKYKLIEHVKLDKIHKDAILIVKSKFPSETIMTHAVAWDGKKKSVKDPAVGFMMTRHRTKKEYQSALLCAIIVG